MKVAIFPIDTSMPARASLNLSTVGTIHLRECAVEIGRLADHPTPTPTIMTKTPGTYNNLHAMTSGRSSGTFVDVEAVVEDVSAEGLAEELPVPSTPSLAAVEALVE